jgi:hypothetical protein
LSASLRVLTSHQMLPMLVSLLTGSSQACFPLTPGRLRFRLWNSDECALIDFSEVKQATLSRNQAFAVVILVRPERRTHIRRRALSG